MRQAFERYLAFRASAVVSETAEGYRTSQVRFFEWAEDEGVTFKNISVSHVAQFMLYAREELDLKASVIRSRLVTLRSFFSWAVSEKLLKENPVDPKRLPKLRSARPLKVPFTEQQYGQVLAKACEVAPHWADPIRLAWHTGLRMSDVMLLPWSAVDLSAGCLKVEPKKKRRFGEQLEIPIVEDLRGMLLRLWGTRENEWVFPEMRGRYLIERSQLSTEFGRLCDKCDLPLLTFHSLRHAFVTRLLSSGVDAVTVSSMTGQTLKQLQDYAHISVQTKAEALERALGQKERVA